MSSNVNRPPYLYDKADFSTDNILMYLEKQACIAHGGKYIEALYEAALPAAINPLTKDEVLEWGDSSLQFIKTPQATKKYRSSGRCISKKSGYVEYTRQTPFFGYKSEPPTSRVFAEDEPHGPAASAIKAAGTLMSILEKNREQSDWVVQAMKNTWGVNLEPIKPFIMPDASNTSYRDLVKLTRTTTHSLYGFPAEQPSGILSLGVYRPGTLRDPVYMDYHTVCLTLRFMGEWACAYNPRMRNASMTESISMPFAPVLSEFPHIYSTKLTPVMADTLFVTKAPLLMLQRHAERSLKFYETEIASLKLTDYTIKSRLKIVGSEQWSNMSLNLMRSPKDQAVIRPTYRTLVEKTSGDMIVLNVPKQNTVIGNVADATYNMSARKAIVYVLSAYIHTRTKNAGEHSLVTFANTRLLNYQDRAREEFVNSFANALPKNMFYAVQKVLTAGSESKVHAQEKIVEFVAKLSYLDRANHDNKLTSSNFFAMAIRHAINIKYYCELIDSAVQDEQAFTHSIKGIKFKSLPTDDIESIIHNGLNTYIVGKARFWEAHYRMRARQWSYKLTLIGKVRSEHRERCVRRAIQYNYFAIVYKCAKFTYDLKLGLSYEIDAKKYQQSFVPSLLNYHKKRLNAHQFYNWNEEEFIKHLFIATDTIGVVNDRFDSACHPTIKFHDLWKLVKEKLKVTVNSAKKVLIKRTQGFIVDESDDLEEVQAMADGDEDNILTPDELRNFASAAITVVTSDDIDLDNDISENSPRFESHLEPVLNIEDIYKSNSPKPKVNLSRFFAIKPEKAEYVDQLQVPQNLTKLLSLELEIELVEAFVSTILNIDVYTLRNWIGPNDRAELTKEIDRLAFVVSAALEKQTKVKEKSRKDIL